MFKPKTEKIGELAKKELELTREELKRTAEAQEKSAKLNGLSTLLQHQITRKVNIFESYEIEQNTDEIIKNVRGLIEDK